MSKFTVDIDTSNIDGDIAYFESKLAKMPDNPDARRRTEKQLEILKAVREIEKNLE